MTQAYDSIEDFADEFLEMVRGLCTYDEDRDDLERKAKRIIVAHENLRHAALEYLDFIGCDPADTLAKPLFDRLREAATTPLTVKEA